MQFSANELIRYRKALTHVEKHVVKQKYKGYDPYDILTSPFPFIKMGKWPSILAIQLFKRLPINLRKLFLVPKMLNPKALGLFLQAYSVLPPSEENRRKCSFLFEKLLDLKTPGISGMAWGYPFPWASPEKFLEAYSPTSVVSGFVVQGLDTYYRAYGDKQSLYAMEQVCLFLSEALFHVEKNEFYAISYSTAQPDFCYNASLLAAEVYARTFSHTGQEAYANIARKALATVLSRQKQDGSWNYSENLETKKQRVQIDFHQGFILDSIIAISNALEYRSEAIEKALQEGFEFYRDHQFAPDGRALWRLPGRYPADIHHQAQGILSASRYGQYSGSSRAEELTKRVLTYTLSNFQDPLGFFYYRKHQNFTDRTNYIRWGDAWMFLALAEALSEKQKNASAV